MDNFDQLVKDLGTILDGPSPDDLTKAFGALLDIAKSQQAQIRRLKKQVRRVAESQARASDSYAVHAHPGTTVAAGDGTTLSLDSFFQRAMARMAAKEPVTAPVTSFDISRAEALAAKNEPIPAELVRRVILGY